MTPENVLFIYLFNFFKKLGFVIPDRRNLQQSIPFSEKCVTFW
jgi:hypothetical protein